MRRRDRRQVRLDKTASVGIGDGVGSVGGAGLGEDATDVAAQRVQADYQLVRDHLVASAGSDVFVMGTAAAFGSPGLWPEIMWVLRVAAQFERNQMILLAVGLVGVCR
jgi:hypothetical protein